MVTSPTPKDGKSTVAANLGVVLAQGQHQVAIMDADLRKPRLHRIFHLANRNGLTDALIQPEISMNGRLKMTKIRNLSVLTTGDLPPNPSELVGSDKMLEIFRSMRNSSDIIIIDTPPVMAVTDPVVLATRVDGVIVVVRPGVTKLAAAVQTVDQLRKVGAPILGVVLNDADNMGKRYSPYYKGYYYQYGSYYDSAPVRVKRKKKSRPKEPVKES
jgi:capsular exopolysaccharide synthesis family protein